MIGGKQEYFIADRDAYLHSDSIPHKLQNDMFCSHIQFCFGMCENRTCPSTAHYMKRQLHFTIHKYRFHHKPFHLNQFRTSHLIICAIAYRHNRQSGCSFCSRNEIIPERSAIACTNCRSNITSEVLLKLWNVHCSSQWQAKNQLHNTCV